MNHKRKVLLLVGTYIDKPSANGICCKKIAKEYLKNNYEVHCVCYGANNAKDNEFLEDNIIIHPVKMTFRTKMLEKYKKSKNKLYLYCSKILNIINMFNYPFINISLLINYYKKVKEINSLNRFDIIISIFHPIESLFSANKIKKRWKSTFWVIYSLDTLTNFTNKKNIINTYLMFKNRIAEKKYFKNADLIVNMKCHEDHYLNSKYDKTKNKMIFSDIPLLEENKSEIVEHNIGNKKIVYAGSLNNKMRNPTYICNFFLEFYKENKSFNVNFYATGNCIEMIKEAESKSSGIISLKDIVSHEEIIKVIKDSDIVISMENKESRMIPSKVFEYFSYQKKIIHFYSSNNDVLLEYFKNYPNVLLINEKNNMKYNIKILNDFFNKETIIVENLSSKFPMNTPEYTYKLINDKYNNYINNDTLSI